MRWRWPLRTVLLWLGFALRASTLEAQGLWRDEVDQWRFAFLSVEELVANFTRPGWNGPLYSPILRLWIALSGDSIYAMRFLSVLWAVLTLALVALLARRLTRDLAAGHMAGALMALSPYMIWYAQEIKMYTWVPMLVLLALYALDRACRRPNLVWWGVVLAATTLAVYSHILAALLVPVLVVWFLAHPARGARLWGGGLIVMAGLTLPYLPLLAWQAPLLAMTRQTGYPDYTLRAMASTLLNGWSLGISQGRWATPAFTIGAMVGMGTLAGTGLLALVLRGKGSRRWRTAVRLVAWCVLPLLCVWLVSLRGSIFTDRYLVWSAPAFYILVAAGLAVIGRLSKALGLVALAAVIVVSAHGWVAQATDEIKPAFESVVEVVEAARRERDLLAFQIPYNHIVYEYYASSGLGEWAAAPYTNWLEPDGSYKVGEAYVNREMRRLLTGYERVWLVYSEAQMWDDRGLVRTWLEANLLSVSCEAFHGVEVCLFARDRG